MTFERELRIARMVIGQAGELSMGYFHKGVTAEDKSDDSPVTIADKESEKLIVQGLLKSFLQDGILGEEGSNLTGTSGRRWIVDPIDGTRDFVRGNRFWASLLGLEVDGVVQLGICALPALGETYWAVRGEGAWRSFNGQETRIHCSDIAEIGRSVACINAINNAALKPYGNKLLEFASRFWAVRSVGGALDAMLLCAGSAELWIEATAKPWDLAPLQVIAQEAGLRFFDHKGNDTIYGGNCMICVPPLEAAAREFLEL